MRLVSVIVLALTTVSGTLFAGGVTRSVEPVTGGAKVTLAWDFSGTVGSDLMIEERYAHGWTLDVQSLSGGDNESVLDGYWTSNRVVRLAVKPAALAQSGSVTYTVIRGTGATSGAAFGDWRLYENGALVRGAVAGAGELAALTGVYAQMRLSRGAVRAATSSSSADDAAADSGAVSLSVANVYDGILSDGDALFGTIRVALSKANAKTGLAKISVAIQPVGGKRISLSGAFGGNGSSFVATAKNGLALMLDFTADGISGTFGDYTIDGARNRYSAKTTADKAAVAEVNRWVGSYALVNENENGYDTFTVAIAKKGKVTLAGILADGTAVSASATMIIGADRCCIPVVRTKKNLSLAFCIWLPLPREDDASAIEVTGFDDAKFAVASNLAGEGAFYVEDEIAGAEATVIPSARKWEVKSEVGLKLTYTAKTGAFKGSYQVGTETNGKRKSVSVTVRGVVFEGTGYGTAVIKGGGAVPVLIWSEGED